MSSARSVRRIDELLLERGLITGEQLEEARAQAAERGRPLGRVLIELGHIDEAELVSILAEQLGLKFVELGELQIDASAVALIPEATARRHSCIPVPSTTQDVSCSRRPTPPTSWRSTTSGR